MRSLNDFLGFFLSKSAYDDIKRNGQVKAFLTVRQQTDLADDLNVLVPHFIALRTAYMNHGVFKAGRISGGK